MLTSEQAIEKAFEYIKGLSEYLHLVDEPRLESIQKFGDDWVATVSFFSERRAGDSPALNSVLQALAYQRTYKEVEIKATTGEVIGFSNPHSRSAVPVA